MVDFECDIEYWTSDRQDRTVNGYYDSTELGGLIGELRPYYFITVWFSDSL